MSSVGFVIIGIILVFLTLGVLFLIPTEKKTAQKKRTSQQAETPADWQALSKKLERHVVELRQELMALQKKEKSLEKEVLVQKDKYVKLQEKLSQERQWQKKEHDDVEKRGKDLVRLQADLKSTEANLEAEHKQRLTFERELKELRENLTLANETRRSLDNQIMKLSAQLDGHRKEISNLRDENAKIAQKNDETTFISRAEYDKVVQELEKLKQIKK